VEGEDVQNESAERFDAMASNFLSSEVHRSSPTIRLLHERTAGLDVASVCDVGCGAGHTGASFAGRSRRIVGVDPSENMLSAFASLAREKGVTVERVRAYAEDVPLPDGTFSFVVSRLAPHHFRDVRRAVKEMARIAKPGGTVAVIDLEGYDEPEIDEFNHALEVLHDPTHVRSYTASNWQAFFEQAGLRVRTMERGLHELPTGLSVRRWCEIGSSGEGAEREIRERLRRAPRRHTAEMEIEERGGEFFMPIRTVMVVGTMT
jgi:ubiquinone/menaquinone biosynthesis C-methylase UbiE